MNLYEINKNYLVLLDELQIDEETGELINPEIYEQIQNIKAAFDEKADSVACYIKNIAATAEAIKNEEMQLSKRRKSYEKKIDSLKEYLKTAMESQGKEKHESAVCKISFRNSEQVHIIDENSLPGEYIRIIEERKPDKSAIKDALKLGVKIEGAEIIKNKNIQIK